MKIALNQSGLRVDAASAVKEESYFCPICGSPVIPKAISSKAVHPYFSHLSSPCTDDWHSDMSEWHYAWQERFPVETREVVLERDGVKHRADVLIKNRVIEFQHSPISAEEFNARNEFYSSCGFRVIWIFDMTDKIKSLEWDYITLKRTQSYLRGYSQKLNYSIFFQDGDRLFWVFHEKRGRFYCSGQYILFTKEMFLKDFGCSSQPNIDSISQAWEDYPGRIRPWTKEDSIKSAKYMRESLVRLGIDPSTWFEC